MPPTAFVCVLALAAAALASWIAIRFPGIAPRSARGLVAWVAAALASTATTSPALEAVAARGGRALLPAFVALPSGVCVMLAAAWVVLRAMGFSR